MTHTPTPWIADEHYVHQDNYGYRPILDVWGTETGSEDAAFIVKAVNSHDKLVEALRAFIRSGDGIPDYNMMPMEVEARKLARRALEGLE